RPPFFGEVKILCQKSNALAPVTALRRRAFNGPFTPLADTPDLVPCCHRQLGMRACVQEYRAVIEYPLLLVFPVAMAFAGAMDLLTMTIPNRISILLVAGFAIAAAAIGIGWAALASHLGAGLLMLVIGIAMFSLGW